MLKKVSAIILALAMCTSMCIATYAESAGASEENGQSVADNKN